MKTVAYLINRYPEASLTTVRREIDAVGSCGIKVLRFAHRPSMQPMAGDRDRAEASQTEYLVSGNFTGLVKSFLLALMISPYGVLKAIAQVMRLKPWRARNWIYLLVASRLRERMAAARAEHLHVHFAQSSAVVAMLAHCLGGPRWTMTVHGPEDFESEHRHVLATLVNNATATLAISDWAAESIRRVVAPVPVSVRVVRMGVDRSFLECPVPIEPSGPILCVARLDRRKGHKVLFEALCQLRTRGLTPQVKLVGDGPFRKQLESDVEVRGLRSQVQFAGWLTEQEVKDSLDRCCLFVLPSHAEGLPVSIMEAFARARPVVASDVAGVHELVLEKKNGCLVPPGDAYALAAAIQSFLQLPRSRLQELGAHGRAEVLARFQSSQNGHSLVQVWRGSVPGKGTGVAQDA